MPAPDKIGNVGCFFKSPVISKGEVETLLNSLPSIQIHPHSNGQYKVSASDLIKACGWDNRRIGDVSVDKNRPIVILNHGSATGSEIYDYSRSIQKDINEKFNLVLEAEVVII
jgi:UDP-N-acetylmuramate dehydrogenase